MKIEENKTSQYRRKVVTLCKWRFEAQCHLPEYPLNIRIQAFRWSHEAGRDRRGIGDYLRLRLETILPTAMEAGHIREDYKDCLLREKAWFSLSDLRKRHTSLSST
ncbi:hypothetical protein CHS0354_038273 [Potamilus streckersoni]|uniref:Uncharacterized protein n=1 Tax=Potamilus streckersoni TaxID=2493646 RepID=A0AAE0WAW1_9BIVA|nr:hypothetical protein CHS0354_038273 [Potamilus streckersoni]